MLHVYKLHDPGVPSYVGRPFIGDLRSEFWFGRLAERLTLPEAPNREAVGALLRFEGLGPRHKGGPGKPIRALQLTFSASKSVSVAALVYGDDRLLAAHEYAVKDALSYIEECLTCRIMRGGITEQEVCTDGAAMAVFHRYASRSGDPLLHSHVIVFNAASVGDGTMRSIDQRFLFEEKQFLGMVYRSALADALKAFGYSVRVHGRGYVDIQGVGAAVCERFCSRKNAIDEIIEEVTGFSPEAFAGRNKVPFVVNSAPYLKVPAFEACRANWRSVVPQDAAAFEQPQQSTSRILWGPSTEAAEALKASFEDMRRSERGVKFARLMCECYSSNQGRHSMRDLLATLEDDLFFGDYKIDGTPRTFFDWDTWLEFYERHEEKRYAMEDAAGAKQHQRHRRKADGMLPGRVGL